MADEEIAAMQAVSAALHPIDEDARGRVLRWAAEKYGGATRQQEPLSVQNGGRDHGLADVRDQRYADVSDLVDAAKPAGGPEFAVAVAYWLQVIGGKATWGGADVNNILKDLGRGLANITKTLTSLTKRKPALVMQTAKSGRAQQARKSYKLTTAGVAYVERMLAAPEGE